MSSPPSPPTPLKMWLFWKRGPRREPSRVENSTLLTNSIRRHLANLPLVRGGGRDRSSSPKELRFQPPWTWKAFLLPAGETHRRMRVGSGIRFPGWKDREANSSSEPGITMSGDPGLESWKSPGRPRGNPASRSALLWNYSQVQKGQARFLGNPAVWGHIHTGADRCPNTLDAHLPPALCVHVWGAVKVPF